MIAGSDRIAIPVVSSARAGNIWVLHEWDGRSHNSSRASHFSHPYPARLEEKSSGHSSFVSGRKIDVVVGGFLLCLVNVEVVRLFG